MGTALDLVLRSLHIIFAIVVFAISITLVATWNHTMREGSVRISLPFALGWATFTGVLSSFASFVGMASNWIEALNGRCTFLLDGVSVLANLLGGVVSQSFKE
jgi:hypothetical protein